MTLCPGQAPTEVESVLQQLSAKRDQQRAIYDAAMEKASRVAVAELTKYGKAEVRKNNLANAITAWQAILKIDPKDDGARRELDKLKQALAGMPAKQLGVGVVKTGLEFTGNGFIQSAIKYSGQTPVVVLEAIVTPKSITKSQAIIADFQSGGIAVWLTVKNGIPRWTFSCYDGSDYKHAYSVKPVVIGKSVHVCGVKNGNFIALFIDGQRQGDWMAVQQFKPSAFPFLIGAEPDANGRPDKHFSGFIDSVRVLQSNTALSPDYIPRLPMTANRFCALLLDLNEGAGNTATDRSPNRRDCPIRGAKWTSTK